MEFKAAITSERTALATEAVNKLGYHKLAHAVLVGNLLAQLRELDIEPLTHSSVEAYKASKAKVGWWMRTKLANLWGLVIGPALGVAAYFATHYGRWDADFHFLNGVAILLSALTVVSAIITIVLVCHVGEGRDTRTRHEWQRQPLKGYTGTVPEFVLRKAVQISDALPTASLSIDQLFQGEEHGRVRPTRDPFLVVSYGDETYYIDVWNEREYEASI